MGLHEIEQLCVLGPGKAHANNKCGNISSDPNRDQITDVTSVVWADILLWQTELPKVTAESSIQCGLGLSGPGHDITVGNLEVMYIFSKRTVTSSACPQQCYFVCSNRI